MASKYTRVSEWRTVGDKRVNKYSIAASDCVVYAAYEPDAGHSSYMHHDGAKLGSVMSRAMPAHVEAMPVGPARWAALDALRAIARAESYAAIVAAFPEAADGKRDDAMGQIEVWGAK